ncbi:MAG: flavodoxin family protein [Clostridiales bacterium]|nr:flavodoxin family protein [Clostridiales bacterium]MCD7753901.1 flavodoxin family protein [Clostridiales bacterium]MCD7880876.1 flavodoxin family protein [Clostridiales bacterium]
MKVLLINGSPHEKGCTYTALAEVASALEREGVETELFWVGNHPVPGCIACGKCAATGQCVFDGGIHQITDELDSIDGIVVGSPVYYASASGQITSFLDRLFYVNGKRMAGKLGASVVSCRRGGATAAFDQLNKYFLISNMTVVGSQYWNQVHGNTPDEVRQDEEGLQTMRTLAANMAWLLKSIRAGREAGVPAPVYEAKRGTNFIR